MLQRRAPFFSPRYFLFIYMTIHSILREYAGYTITQTGLVLSLLGGDHEIIDECLKFKKVNNYCMRFAIISHNFEFVKLVMDGSDIKINFLECYKVVYMTGCVTFFVNVRIHTILNDFVSFFLTYEVKNV